MGWNDEYRFFGIMDTRLEKVKGMNQNSPEPYKYDLMIRKEQ